MNYIDKLLNGKTVEWKALGEVAIKISSGGTPKTGTAEYYNGDIPWLRTQEVGSGDIWDTEIKITDKGLKNSSAKIIPANCVIIAMYGATVGKVGINKIPLSTNQACANIQINDKIANYRYVYHFLLSQYEYIKSLGAGSQTNINAQIVKSLTIPIPPLSVQQEIVRILDSFTELTAELTARKKQYKYYREELLVFSDELLVGSGQRKAEWKTLGEVSNKITSGVTPLASNSEFYDGDIPWLRTSEVRFIDIWDTEIKVTEKALKETSLKWIPANCVIVAISGATAGRVGINKIPLTTNQHCCCFDLDDKQVSYRYVFHYLSCVNNEILQLKQGARGDLNAGNLKRFKIPIPPLSEQERIVGILDKFDTLVNSISEGLPKEIELREKQYAYYRDLLLTFN